MSHADIYFQANEQLQLKNLASIDEEYFNSVDKSYWDESTQTLSYQEWQDVLSQKGYEINRIKRNLNTASIRQFFYQGEYLTPEINTIDPSWLLNEFTISCLKADKYGKEEFEKGEYTLYFFSERNLFAIDYFLRHYDKIAKEDLYSAFKNLYVYCNYGFELFPQDKLDEIFAVADNKEGVTELREADIVDEEGYLTIYRGEGKRSTALERAYSWTLSLDIANRFGHHFEKGKTYTAKVKLEKIIDYISERNEEEVWVRYTDIEDLQELSTP